MFLHDVHFFVPFIIQINLHVRPFNVYLSRLSRFV